jgi:Domain of unknown function (DUF4382)
MGTARLKEKIDPMKIAEKMTGVITLLTTLMVSGCGTCGFDCSDDEELGPAILTLSFSDALPEDLDEVVLEVDSLVFERSSATDVQIDSFDVAAEDPNQPDDSFVIDLLEFPGVNRENIIEDQELERGTYSGIVINLTPESEGVSYVRQEDGLEYPLVVDENGLELPGFTLYSGSESYTIEFDLALSLRFDEDNDRYHLNSTGVRVVDNTISATLTGIVDVELFDGIFPCSEKEDWREGNRAYLYQGTDLDQQLLADAFTSGAPADAIAPFSVGTIDLASNGNWEYVFGYLPAGDYTVAFTCDAEEDNPESYDDLPIPFPTDQLYEISLPESNNTSCNMNPDSNGECQGTSD